MKRYLTYTNDSNRRFFDDHIDKINQQKDTHIKTLGMVVLGQIYLRGSMKRNLSCVKDVFMYEIAPDIFHFGIQCCNTA